MFKAQMSAKMLYSLQEFEDQPLKEAIEKKFFQQF